MKIEVMDKIKKSLKILNLFLRKQRHFSSESEWHERGVLDAGPLVFPALRLIIGDAAFLYSPQFMGFGAA